MRKRLASSIRERRATVRQRHSSRLRNGQQSAHQKVDLATGSTTLLAGVEDLARQFAGGEPGRQFDHLPGRQCLALAHALGDRCSPPSRLSPVEGVNADEDDSFLSFSPDGLYIALVQTFHVGGTGATAPDQVRKASDGSLVYSTSGMTMGVWASVPSRLFFRDSAGTVHRWDPSSGLSSMLPLTGFSRGPHGTSRWIAYTFRTSSGLGGIGLYSVQANSVSNTTPPGRSQARFLTTTLVWYIRRARLFHVPGRPAERRQA